MERFLEFLYTGSYSDGVAQGLKNPSSAAMMSPDDVQEALQCQPGACDPGSVTDSGSGPSICEQEPESSDLSPEVESDAEISADDAQSQDDTHSQVFGPVEEPVEEYNEFGGSVSGDRSISGDQSVVSAKSGIFEEETWLEQQKELERLALVGNDLFLPLRLFIMADKYDVPALRLLSRDRFYRAAELTWEKSGCFPDVVDELYSSTCNSDVALREIVCRLVGSRLIRDEIREKMRPVMEKHGEFATGVMEYFIYFMCQRAPYLRDRMA